jgi:hypothetical protein
MHASIAFGLSTGKRSTSSPSALIEPVELTRFSGHVIV